MGLQRNEENFLFAKVVIKKEITKINQWVMLKILMKNEASELLVMKIKSPLIN